MSQALKQFGEISLRLATGEDKLRVLNWRNKEPIRNNMLTNHVISLEEHSSWWGKLPNRNDIRFLICEDTKCPKGVVIITALNPETKTCSWAFYIGEDDRRPGLGSFMEFMALEMMFFDLGVEQIFCEVLSHNMPVVNMHQKFGFTIDEIKKNILARDNENLDLYCLSLKKEDWLQQRNHHEKRLQERLN